MKGMRTIILPIILMAFIVLGSGMASAAVNVFVNATMPYDVLYKGEIVSANVTVKNNENFPVRIYSVGVHYDWMPESLFSSVDFGGSYLQVESNGITSPGQLLIQCDSNVSAGYHSFYYKVEMTWYNSYTSTWVNETVVQPGTIYVESPLKPEALQELQFANKTLYEAKTGGFSSQKAIAYINNATGLLNDGWSAYNSGEYARALNDAKQSLDLVSNAKIEERNFRESIADIEKVVATVNDKLKTVSATDDPATASAIAESKGYLDQTRRFIDAYNLTSAKTYANLANGAADKAIQQQFYYSLKANQTEAEKNKARAALDNAQAVLNSASNMTGTSSQNIMDDARNKLGDATVLFDRKDYTNATITANVVTSLEQQAEKDEADHRMMLARNKISSIGELKSPEAKGLRENASLMYNQSQRDYISSNFKDSILHADSSLRLADNASITEQQWRDQNPLSTVTPGFGLLAALLAIGLIVIWKERKV